MNNSLWLGEAGCAAVLRLGVELPVLGAPTREEGEWGQCVIFLCEAGTPRELRSPLKAAMVLLLAGWSDKALFNYLPQVFKYIFHAAWCVCVCVKVVVAVGSGILQCLCSCPPPW